MSSTPFDLWFPNLARSGYAITSERTSEYNCIAWAAGDVENWWWPPPDPDLSFWPGGVPRERTLERFIQTFGTLGYEVCDYSDLEKGFDKIALYVSENGLPTHAARQLPSGYWTSKLGEAEDIEHNTLEALQSQVYGRVSTFLKRRQK